MIIFTLISNLNIIWIWMDMGFLDHPSDIRLIFPQDPTNARDVEATMSLKLSAKKKVAIVVVIVVVIPVII